MYYYAYTADGLGFRIVFDGWDLYPGETLYDHELSESEKMEHLPDYVPLAWRNIQYNARTELVLSDMVAIRCFKAGLDFPPEWREYVETLRVIVRTRSGDVGTELPVAPHYPAGT